MNHPIRLAPWVCLLLLPILASCSDTSTLPGGVCNPLTHRKALVRFAGRVEEKMLPAGSPVTRQGGAIGTVAAILPMENGTRSDVALCLRQDSLPSLARVTVFYLDRTAPLPVLACVPVEASGALNATGQDLVFAGFPSQEDFLAWRAGQVLQQGLQQGLGQLLQGLEQAIQGLPRPGQPNPPAN